DFYCQVWDSSSKYAIF
nr:immunoglobulin light chain junction region [Macaca mulatta]MOW17309.1 immunoglobulin light chain junction region [Macaca mulatta]